MMAEEVGEVKAVGAGRGWKATQAEPGQRAIYDALGVPSSPGGIRKMIV